MNQHWINISRLIVDNTQPEYPQYVVKVVAMVAGKMEGDTREFGIQYVFDVAGQPPADTFTSYDQLSEEQVLAWINSEGMAEQVADAYARVDALITPVAMPIQDATPPWVPAETPGLLPPAGAASASVVTDTSATSTATVVTSFVPTEETLTALIYRVLDEIEASKV